MSIDNGQITTQFYTLSLFSSEFSQIIISNSWETKKNVISILTDQSNDKGWKIDIKFSEEIKDTDSYKALTK